MMETQQRNTEYRHVENSNNINNQHIGQTNITVFYVHLSTQINKSSDHSEYSYKTLPDGSFQKVNIRKRPGSVAIASAIQNKYGITAVPHIICKGFTKDEYKGTVNGRV